MRNCPKCQRSNVADASFCSDCGHRFASQSSELPSLHEDLVLPFAVGAQVALGRYVIEAVLGQGGMGTVYRALDVSLDRRCALKVLNSELTAHPTARKRMEREARALARIEHPNVVQVRNIFLEGELLVMELEYMDGGDLRSRVGSDGVDPAQAVAWMQGVLAGVQALHDAQLVHRDIKPENVLLSGQGVPKLTDLGVARDDAESGRTKTRLGAVLGTLEYMSPEQIQGLAVDARSDVYACGMVLYQLVTGALPFSAKSDFEWQEAHVRRPPDMAKLRAKAPHLAAVVGRAIAKDPAERFASAAEMAAGLVGLAAVGRVVAAAAASVVAEPVREAVVPTEPVPAPAVRGKVGLGLAVLVGVPLLLGVLVVVTGGPPAGGDAAVVAPAPSSLSAQQPGMVQIPGGTFQMGSAPFEGESDEKLHTVTLSGFWLKPTEVTQGEWTAVMGSNPAQFTACGSTCPVEQVSWNDAVAYCNKLSERENLQQCYVGERFVGLGCTGYRLPTEAEWEYAARAGTTGARHGEVGAVAWYGENSNSTTHPVGQKQANAWGLYDMLGNVWEWTNDWKGDYPSSATDPVGPDSGQARVLRGGCWDFDAARVRSAYRLGFEPGSRNFYFGFRPARSVP